MEVVDRLLEGKLPNASVGPECTSGRSKGRGAGGGGGAVKLMVCCVEYSQSFPVMTSAPGGMILQSSV